MEAAKTYFAAEDAEKTNHQHWWHGWDWFTRI